MLAICEEGVVRVISDKPLITRDQENRHGSVITPRKRSPNPIFQNTQESGQGRGRSGASIEPSCQGLPAAATLAACATLFSGPDASCGFVAVSVSRPDNTPYALNLLPPSSLFSYSCWRTSSKWKVHPRGNVLERRRGVDVAGL